MYRIASFLIAAFVPLASADMLTLQDALQEAGANSPSVQKAQSSSNEAYWKKVESRSAFLPSISGSVNYLTDYKYMYINFQLPGAPAPVAIPNIVPTTIYTLNAQYGLFDGFASTNHVRAASWGEKAANEQMDWTRFQVQRQVTLQFYRALAAKTLKQVAEQNLKTLQDHLNEIKLYKKSGMSTNYDVLRIEVQVSEANSEVMNASDEVETASGRLAQMIGSDNAVEPKGDLPEPPASIVEKADFNGDRGDLTALRDQTEALRYQKKAAAAHWVPRVAVFGQYNYYDNLNDRFSDWDAFRNAYEVGFNMTWNIFDGFSSEAKNRQALEQEVQSEKTLRSAQLQAGQDVAMWKRKYAYYQTVFKARQSDIGKSKESVRLAHEGRRVGSRTNTDLLDAETDLFRSQAGAVQAQLGMIEALINLELSTGKKLYDF